MPRPLVTRTITAKTLRAIAEQALDARDISTEVRRYHYRSLEVFFHFVKENGSTRDIFRKYKQFIREKNLATNTKNQFLCSARIFLRELNYEGILATDITLNTRGFVQDKRHKRDGLNKCELEILTAKLQSLPPNSKNNRLKAIISLMLFQGLRAMEIVGLKVNDIGSVNKKASILGTTKR